MLMMMEGEWDAMNYKISKNVLNFERRRKKGKMMTTPHSRCVS